MKELVDLIERTDTATPAELPEIYKQIMSAWDALERSEK